MRSSFHWGKINHPVRSPESTCRLPKFLPLNSTLLSENSTQRSFARSCWLTSVSPSEFCSPSQLRPTTLPTSSEHSGDPSPVHPSSAKKCSFGVRISVLILTLNTEWRSLRRPHSIPLYHSRQGWGQETSAAPSNITYPQRVRIQGPWVWMCRTWVKQMSWFSLPIPHCTPKTRNNIQDNLTTPAAESDHSCLGLTADIRLLVITRTRE